MANNILAINQHSFILYLYNNRKVTKVLDNKENDLRPIHAVNSHEIYIKDKNKMLQQCDLCKAWINKPGFLKRPGLGHVSGGSLLSLGTAKSTETTFYDAYAHILSSMKNDEFQQKRP